MSHQVIAVYSEAGGATKTTTAVALAVCAALDGRTVNLVDLDPRGATTKWTGVHPRQEGLHVGAILAEPEPDGWIDQLAVTVPWQQVPTLRVVPSSRQVSNREKAPDDHADVRLRRALIDTAADLTVLDLPNRQGGPLVTNALTAATTILYAGKLDEDGLDGVDGAATTVQRFRSARQAIGAPVELTVAGVVIGAVREIVMTRDARRALAEFQAAYGADVLEPLIPERVIVRESRAAGEYFGFYAAGQPVHDAYQQIARKVIR